MQDLEEIRARGQGRDRTSYTGAIVDELTNFFIAGFVVSPDEVLEDHDQALLGEGSGVVRGNYRDIGLDGVDHCIVSRIGSQGPRHLDGVERINDSHLWSQVIRADRVL